MKHVLGIETSCDETAVAIYAGDAQTGAIQAESIASQIDRHAPFGGIVPEIASREHLALLPGMVDEIMLETGIAWDRINAIAVTAGPGLLGALLVGISFARAAGMVSDIPVLPIHHMEGHLLAPGLEGDLPEFPFITLLVSGGHTLLLRADDIGRYVILGQSVDDAAGECLDKTARLMGLPYPGGPAIEQLARGGNPRRTSLPRPMLRSDNLNFSFSGLKTAVMRSLNDADNPADDGWRRDLAASLQGAVVEVLVSKTIRACEQTGIPRLVVAGGVSANASFRESMQSAVNENGLSLTLPNPRHCTDNGAMIAYAGFLRLLGGKYPHTDWDAKARWPLDEI
ncbi:MAG: tRNA (adenosine(37)-N6)-threonylcarbamoyltransferase complex transferase subunit TsaD [Mariprofundaceae bacterium]